MASLSQVVDRDPKSLLYVTPEIKRDYLDYKDRSMLSREIAIRIKHAQEKGRWFAWGYVKGGEVPMPDFLEHEYDEQQYFKMLFGEPKDNGWNFICNQECWQCGSIIGGVENVTRRPYRGI